MVSSPIFKYFMNDNQNSLEFTSYIKLNNYVFDKKHFLKIYAPESQDISYELRCFINHKESG